MLKVLKKRMHKRTKLKHTKENEIMYSLQGEQNPRAHIATSASNGIFHETTMDTCALFGFYGMAVCISGKIPK